MAEFIESERALAKRARSHGSVPEPVVIGAGRSDDAAVSMVKAEPESASEPEVEDDDFADAIPASSVQAGQTVLLDDSGGELVPVTVDDVEVRRNKKGEVSSTVLIVGTGRVKTRITFDATGVVALPDPDSVGAPV